MRRFAPRSRAIADGLGVAATDVVMNLFIFFLIAFALLATFTKRKQVEEEQRTRPRERVLEMELPASAQAAGEAEAGALTIDYTEAGEVRLEGRVVAREGLSEALGRVMGGTPRPVVLRAHRGSQLGEAVGVLDLIRAAGPSSVSIATVER